MPAYDVYIFCDECSQPHPGGIRLNIDDPNLDHKSIGDLYSGQRLPPELVMMTNNTFLCPNTKKPYTQTDNQQVFLVAVAE